MPILALVMANLPTIIKAGQAGWDLINKIRSAAKQDNIWTEEHETQYQSELNAANTAPESLTDKERGLL